jgi:hypothetical protein
MPRLLFYAGTAFCLFVALTGAAELAMELRSGTMSFAAMGGGVPHISPRSGWAIVVALIAGLAVSAMFLRMAALLAARNLFGAFMSVLCVGGSVISLSALLLLQARIVSMIGSGAAATDPPVRSLIELHFAGFMLTGFFVSLSLLALRPYFRIQASRVLAATVMLPVPLYAMVLLGDLLFAPSVAPLPASTPASVMFFATLSFLFVAIAIHCIRHRHLFLEMTNLRELLDSRVDPAVRARAVRLGGDAVFDS